MYIYMNYIYKEYIYVNYFAVHLKLTQHCKSVILQFKKTAGQLNEIKKTMHEQMRSSIKKEKPLKKTKQKS